MDHEQINVLIERQARAWEQGNLSALVSDFAPDALFITPGGHHKGQDAIRKAAQSALQSVREVKVIVTRIVFDGEDGAVEWTWIQTDRKTDQRQTVEDAIIFTLRGDKIIYWREYFDTAALEPSPATSGVPHHE